jgi:hypothetical protein
MVMNSDEERSPEPLLGEQVEPQHRAVVVAPLQVVDAQDQRLLARQRRQ